MSIISAEDIHFSYGQPVLKGVSVTVQEGEFFVIIGPNGSGKTTFLKILSGLVKPVKGRVLLSGKEIVRYSRRAISQKVSVVPQQAPIDFPFTVAETVLMGRSPHLGFLKVEGVEDRQIARQAMVFTEVAHLADRYLDQLSGGERQRVMIARAICQQPQIIMLDEPTASLDLAHQVKVMDLMEQLRKESSFTIVMVSHDLNLAAMYGDRLLLLKDGMTVAVGRPSEVLREKTVEDAYGCRVVIEESAMEGILKIMPLPHKYGRRHGSG